MTILIAQITTHAKDVGPRTYAIEVHEVRYHFQNCWSSCPVKKILKSSLDQMFWYEFENESVCICQNTDWLQLWRSNMANNAKNNQ